MKTKENNTTYHCDYCREYYLRKSACEKHEKYCRNNPSNTHACWGCEHLLKDKTDGTFDTPPSTQFTCKKLNKYLYSYIAERRDLVERLHVEYDGEIERMPAECEHFSVNLPF